MKPFYERFGGVTRIGPIFYVIKSPDSTGQKAYNASCLVRFSNGSLQTISTQTNYPYTSFKIPKDIRSKLSADLRAEIENQSGP